MDTCPSGCQVEIAYNDQRAIVVEVGDGIRRYEVNGRSVFDPYPIEAMCDGAHGAPLIPWPNRLADGQHCFDGVRPCPYGTGQQPYLSPGVGLIDQCTLQLAGTEAVGGTIYDFRESSLLEATTLAFAFTGLVRDADDRAWARLRGSDGRQAKLCVDESYPIIELYTGDTLAPERRRNGLGAEPISCPPNAFASGDGLTRLEPGHGVSMAWGARLT